MLMKKRTIIIICILIVLILVGLIYAIVLKNNSKMENREPDSTTQEQPYFFGKVIESNAQYIIVEPNETEMQNEPYKILSKDENQYYDYDIYAYNVEVKIEIDGETLDLKDALLNNRITMEEIIEKANKDFPNAVSYDDGGSMEYHYKNYTIIKCHKLDGNRDVYFGTPEMTINDVK